MKGIVISGTGSGSGKTSIATGLMSVLSKKMRVQPYKVGPDFIDPMYHGLATGRPGRNLDTFMTSKETVKNIVGCTSKDADLCIVEGVRGLYEGQSGIDDAGSTAEIAKILGFPVILVVDTRSITRSAAAIINGFKSFDGDVDIKGVILNNVSGPQHEGKLRDAIERHCDVDIIGVVRKRRERLKERHLGLNTVNADSMETIERLADLVSNLDTDRIMDVCESADSDLPDDPLYTEHEYSMKAAVPMDDAYCFYYRDNLDCMRAAGIEVETFSPLNGDHLPDADMYYLGGGYPELYCAKLSENRDFLDGLRNASDEGKPIIGECGGLMSLCSSIEDMDGVKHPMAGIIDGDAVMSGRHGPTYNIADATSDNPIFRGTVKGHSFHYSEIKLRKEYPMGFSMIRGGGVTDTQDGIVVRNTIGSYTHQHALSCKDWLGGLQDRTV